MLSQARRADHNSKAAGDPNGARTSARKLADDPAKHACTMHPSGTLAIVGDSYTPNERHHRAPHPNATISSIEDTEESDRATQ